MGVLVSTVQGHMFMSEARSLPRYGVVPDYVYGHDKFGPVNRETEGPLYLLESDHCLVVAALKGKAQGLADLVAERDREIERLSASRPGVLITGAELQEALQFLAPDHTYDQLALGLIIEEGDATFHSGPGLYASHAECMEEGCILLTGKGFELAARPVLTMPGFVGYKEHIVRELQAAFRWAALTAGCNVRETINRDQQQADSCI